MADDGDWQATQRERLFFTWTAQRAAKSFAIDDARGAKFHVPGKGWVLDCESQVYNVNVGHRHPHVQRRMVEQIEALPAAAPNVLLPVRAELAARLCARTGLSKAFLTTGGAEALENAVKIARLYTGRAKVITRRRSYHGATLAMLAMAGDPRREPFFADAPGAWVDDEYPPRAPTASRASDWVESLDEVLEREGPGNVAAIVLEGFTGTNGMQHPPRDFWPHVRETCDRHGIVLVADEVFSGFGRTGRWFAVEHEGVVPDAIALGKGLTSGYAPLAGVVVAERIARHFEAATLSCGLTTYAHPVSCAAAAACMDVIEREHMVENAAARGDQLRARLQALRELPPGRTIADVRGLGLMQCVELDRPAAPLSAELWELDVYAPCRNRMLFLCPPLCIDAQQIHDLVDRIGEALTRVADAPAVP